MHNSVLTGVLLVLALGMPLVMLARRVGVSALVAYLVTGTLVGLLGVVTGEEMGVLAEMGASLLLFSLGLEMDLQQLRKRLRRLLVGATGQIGLTLGAGTGVMILLGEEWRTAVALGCCLTLSSTLMVLRALDEHRLRNRDEGQTVLGLLLAQDFAIAPLLLLIALVLPDTGGHQTNSWVMAAGVVGVLLATVLMRRLVASPIMAKVQAAGLPELEVAFAVTLALGAAWFTESMGLGAAVGAFCAGLALGGDEHRHAIETATRPLQGLLAILFFVSVGMQFEPAFVLDNVWQVVGGLLVAMVAKAALAGFALRLSGMTTRSAIGAGIMVGQVGEFSFVLAAHAYQGGAGPLSQDTYRLVISIAVLSLALTPFLIAIARQFLPRIGVDRSMGKGDSIVVAGLGPVGFSVVQNLHAVGYPLLLVDRNDKLLEPWSESDGVISHLGRIEDMEDWLPILGERPQAVILTFPIADTSAVVADRLLRFDPTLVIIARAPYEAQIPILHNAGVHHVICDEHATAAALGPLLENVLDAAGDHRATELKRKTTRAHHRREEDQAVDPRISDEAAHDRD